MITLDAGEIHETRDVAETNRLLAIGWKLLSIERDWRGHFYILGARTVAEASALELHQNNQALPQGGK